MLQAVNTGEDKSDFLVEEINRYRISVSIGNTSATNISNDLEYLKKLYDTLIDDNINNPNRVIIVIFDYDKDTNVYYYDSEYEQC